MAISLSVTLDVSRLRFGALAALTIGAQSPASAPSAVLVTFPALLQLFVPTQHHPLPK